jgi:trehalose 6-phosphate synthase
MADCNLQVSAGPQAVPEHLATIPEEVIKGHYRFCNEFLWPIMHDLPQYCNYVPQDRAYYETFNQTLGWCIIRGWAEGQPRDFFVQDYQLAPIPAFLKGNAGFRSLVFWHIPWPKHVSPEHAPVIADIAQGLLSAAAIGFHTDEYARNFMNFVAEHLPEYSCSPDAMAIWSTEVSMGTRKLALLGNARAPKTLSSTHTQLTRVVVAPLGIDFDHWSTLAAEPMRDNWHPVLAKTPFILSVDRADYTKGVIDRIQAIDLLLQRHPEWIGRIVFAQICGKTRTGLKSFDNYWDECHVLYNELQQKYSTESWQPLVWLESTYSSAELAKIYRSAEGMLVNAVRDGLNLTAKEFVACQDNHAGVLALSKGTGAWDELGNHAVGLEPGNAGQIADSLHHSLMMSGHERKWRMAMLKDKVRSNSLSGWWYKFSRLLISNPQQEFQFKELLQETS